MDEIRKDKKWNLYFLSSKRGKIFTFCLYKECLRHDITPFIIEETKKNYYYKGLAQWKDERGWLIDTCLDGQDTFTRLMEMLDIL